MIVTSYMIDRLTIECTNEHKQLNLQFNDQNSRSISIKKVFVIHFLKISYNKFIMLYKQTTLQTFSTIPSPLHSHCHSHSCNNYHSYSYYLAILQIFIVILCIAITPITHSDPITYQVAQPHQNCHPTSGC